MKKIFLLLFTVCLSLFFCSIVSAQNLPGTCVELAWQCDGPGTKITHTPCNTSICVACPITSLAYRTECVTQNTDTPDCGPGTALVENKCVPDSEVKSTLDNSSENITDNNNDPEDVISLLKQASGYLVDHILKPVWSTIKTTFSSIIKFFAGTANLKEVETPTLQTDKPQNIPPTIY